MNGIVSPPQLYNHTHTLIQLAIRYHSCYRYSTASTNTKPHPKPNPNTKRNTTKLNEQINSTLNYIQQQKQQQHRHRYSRIEPHSIETKQYKYEQPINPITKVTELSTLHPYLYHQLQSMDIVSLTAIQQAVLPHLLNNDLDRHNILIHSHTGTGKTLCYLLPILSRILYKYDSSIHTGTIHHKYSIDSMIVLPTVELIIQVQSLIHTVINNKIHYNKLYYMVDSRVDSKQTVSDIQQNQPYILIGTAAQLHKLLFEQKVQPVEFDVDIDDDEIINDHAKLNNTNSIRLTSIHSLPQYKSPIMLATKPLTHTYELLSSLNTLIVDEIDTICKPLPKITSPQQLRSYNRHPPGGLLLISSIHKYILQSHSFIGVSATINSQLRSLLYRHGYNSTNPLTTLKSIKYSNTSSISNNDSMLPNTIQHYYCIAPTYQQIQSNDIHNTSLTIDSVVQDRMQFSQHLQSEPDQSIKRDKHNRKLHSDELTYGISDITDKYRTVALLYTSELRSSMKSVLVFVDQTISIDDISTIFHSLQCNYVWLHQQVMNHNMDQRNEFLDSVKHGTLDKLILCNYNTVYGIDLLNISHIFICTQLYNINVMNYVHLAGRTGRNQNNGNCTIVVSPGELYQLNKYQQSLNIQFNRLLLPDLPPVDTDTTHTVQ